MPLRPKTFKKMNVLKAIGNAADVTNIFLKKKAESKKNVLSKKI
jgi:hypothetical protein